jgi:hypothetical protein
MFMLIMIMLQTLGPLFGATTKVTANRLHGFHIEYSTTVTVTPTHNMLSEYSKAAVEHDVQSMLLVYNIPPSHFIDAAELKVCCKNVHVDSAT